MDEPDPTFRLRALNAVLQVAVRHPNLLQPMAFEALAEAIGRFVPCRAMSIILPDGPGYFRMYATAPGSALPFTSGARMPIGPDFHRTIFVDGAPFRRDDMRTGTEVAQRAADQGNLSYVALPVRASAPADGVIAALVLTYGEVGASASAPIALLEEIAAVIGASFERSLQLSRERRLAMILDTSGEAMLAWDREGRVTDLNGAAEALTGRRREELVGTPIEALLGPLPPLGEAEPQGVRLDLRARAEGGAEALRVVSATITAVDEDPLVASHALLRDLSQVALAERAAAERLARIRELEEQHRTLLDNAPLIIFRLDPATGELVYLNRHAERVLGVPIPEALWTPNFLRDAHDPDGARLFEEAVASARLGVASLPYEARLRRRDGDAIIARGTVYPLVSDREPPGAEPPAVVAIEGVLADVSAEHAARARLVQLDRLSTLGTLAAGVAHEINNPAAFIMLGLDMLDRLLRGANVRMEGAAATNAADLLRELRDSIRRIVDIARDLRLFAAPPARDPARRALVDANHTVESAISLTRGQIIERAQIVTRLTEVPPVLMDGGRLGQVLVNLLVNAAQAIPKDAGLAAPREHAVTVETRSDGHTVEIEVRDTGVGIREEDLQRIWTPFFTTKGPEIGTGLGLSISREIVERAGGALRVESPAPGADPPCGSRFVITLPAAGHEAPAAPVEVAPAARPAGDAERVSVLVVEDEAALGRALAEQIGRFHAVTVAPSADAAIRLLGGGARFDAVLCDLRMPGMSGEALWARAADIDPALARAFVFMSGVGFGADVERFLSSAGQPLLEKPFATDDALAAIAEVVARRRARGGA